MEGQVAKRRRFSMETDLEVEVDEEVFLVHSYVLMSRSPVFAKMLSTDMSEAHAGRIHLKGKSKVEFREFLAHLDNGAAELPAITTESLPSLLRWADEYGVEALRNRCEAFLLTQPAGDFEALKVAVEYRLSARRDQCVKELRITPKPELGSASIGELIRWARECEVPGLRERCEAVLMEQPADDIQELNFARDNQLEARHNQCVSALTLPFNVFKHRAHLLDMKDDAKFVSKLLPALYDALWLDQPWPHEPDSLSVEILWPIVMRALELAEGWRSWEEMQLYAKHADALEKLVLSNLPKTTSAVYQRERYRTPQQLQLQSAKQIESLGKALFEEVVRELGNAEVIARIPERDETDGIRYRDEYGEWYAWCRSGNANYARNLKGRCRTHKETEDASKQAKVRVA